MTSYLFFLITLNAIIQTCEIPVNAYKFKIKTRSYLIDVEDSCVKSKEGSNDYYLTKGCKITLNKEGPYYYDGPKYEKIIDCDSTLENLLDYKIYTCQMSHEPRNIIPEDGCTLETNHECYYDCKKNYVLRPSNSRRYRLVKACKAFAGDTQEPHENCELYLCNLDFLEPFEEWIEYNPTLKNNEKVCGSIQQVNLCSFYAKKYFHFETRERDKTSKWEKGERFDLSCEDNLEARMIQNVCETKVTIRPSEFLQNYNCIKQLKNGCNLMADKLQIKGFCELELNDRCEVKNHPNRLVFGNTPNRLVFGCLYGDTPEIETLEIGMKEYRCVIPKIANTNTSESTCKGEIFYSCSIKCLKGYGDMEKKTDEILLTCRDTLTMIGSCVPLECSSPLQALNDKTQFETNCTENQTGDISAGCTATAGKGYTFQFDSIVSSTLTIVCEIKNQMIVSNPETLAIVKSVCELDIKGITNSQPFTILGECVHSKPASLQVIGVCELQTKIGHAFKVSVGPGNHKLLPKIEVFCNSGEMSIEIVPLYCPSETGINAKFLGENCLEDTDIRNDEMFCEIQCDNGYSNSTGNTSFKSHCEIFEETPRLNPSPICYPNVCPLPFVNFDEYAIDFTKSSCEITETQFKANCNIVLQKHYHFKTTNDPNSKLTEIGFYCLVSNRANLESIEIVSDYCKVEMINLAIGTIPTISNDCKVQKESLLFLEECQGNSPKGYNPNSYSLKCNKGIASEETISFTPLKCGVKIEKTESIDLKAISQEECLLKVEGKIINFLISCEFKTNKKYAIFDATGKLLKSKRVYCKENGSVSDTIVIRPQVCLTSTLPKNTIPEEKCEKAVVDEKCHFQCKEEYRLKNGAKKGTAVCTFGTPPKFKTDSVCELISKNNPFLIMAYVSIPIVALVSLGIALLFLWKKKMFCFAKKDSSYLTESLPEISEFHIIQDQPVQTN